MKTLTLSALVGAMVMVMAGLPAEVQAQSLRGHLGGAPGQPLDPAKRVSPPASSPAPQYVLPAGQPAAHRQQQQPTAAPVSQALAPAPAPAAAPYVPAPVASPSMQSPSAAESRVLVDASAEAPSGGFFLGVQGGKGRVYEDVDQSARMVNVGYRWQAGPIAKVGVELAHGQLGGTSAGNVTVEKIDYSSIGANARFNFGRTSPVYMLVRSGYWRARTDDAYGDVDGGYVGAGLGVDIGNNFSLNLLYTHHLYFDDYEYYRGGGYYDSINRADTLMFGAEVRF